MTLDKLEEDVEAALELLETVKKETADGIAECEFCDLSVGCICESCFMAGVILRMKNKIRSCSCDQR